MIYCRYQCNANRCSFFSNVPVQNVKMRVRRPLSGVSLLLSRLKKAAGVIIAVEVGCCAAGYWAFRKTNRDQGNDVIGQWPDLTWKWKKVLNVRLEWGISEAKSQFSISNSSAAFTRKPSGGHLSPLGRQGLNLLIDTASTTGGSGKTVQSSTVLT